MQTGALIAVNPPISLEAALRQASQLLSQQNPAGAEAVIRNALAIWPDQPDLVTFLASAYEQAGRVEDAENLYRHSLALKPRQIRVATQIGHMLRNQGRYTEAVEAFHTAIQIKTDYADAHHGLAIALQRQERLDDAIISFDKALSIEPNNIGILINRGIVLGDLLCLEGALASFDAAIEINPNHVGALVNRGVTQQSLARFEDALASYDAALKIEAGHAAALSNRGIALQHLKRFEEALSSFAKALEIQSENAETWNNHGVALQHLRRFEEALASYDKVLSLRPEHAEAWNNRGVAMQNLERFEEALVCYDKALALRKSYTEAWNNRGVSLQRLKRFEEALKSCEAALELESDHVGALHNIGLFLCENDFVEEGLAAFARHAEVVRKSQPDKTNEPLPLHKVRHDLEQSNYLTTVGFSADHQGVVKSRPNLADGSRLATRAINPNNATTQLADQWKHSRPQIAVIDNLLTDGALEKLRRYCWGSTIWRRVYENGYLGAMPEHGFACPLLAQIAEELRSSFPVIFGDHSLRYLWAFKYDSELAGISIHADQAAVNVNFWITPDDANLDPESGGLVVWDVSAPLDWDFAKYNSDTKAIRDFLARTGARPITIPYRANRAVIFDSDLFHETDKIKFKPGYLNRRINVTLLYGQR